MPYTAPTAADLKTRFPEFDTIADAMIEAIISENAATMSTSWLEDDYTAAYLSLVAHCLTVEGEPGRSAGVAGAASGPIKRVKVGDVETEFASAGVVQSAATYGLSDTPYGQRFLRLRHKSFPATMLI